MTGCGCDNGRFGPRPARCCSGRVASRGASPRSRSAGCCLADTPAPVPNRSAILPAARRAGPVCEGRRATSRLADGSATRRSPSGRRKRGCSANVSLRRRTRAPPGQAEFAGDDQCQHLRGTLLGSGISGTFAGADGKIGRVPLDISNAAGRWSVLPERADDRWRDDRRRRAAPARFYPLRSRRTCASRSPTGLFHANGSQSSGERDTHRDGGHRPSRRTGPGAPCSTLRIRFGPGASAEELTGLPKASLRSLPANYGQGGSPGGTGAVKSTGEFTMRDTTLQRGGLSPAQHHGSVHRPDPTRDRAGKIATIKAINPGILVENGVVRYSLLPGRLVRVERANGRSWAAA